MILDIISYSAASKVAKQEKKTRENILGIGVQGSSLDVKARIDSLENGIEKVNELANQLIVQDAINIMKAHAKLNAIAKTTKYKMHNMFFDDLLDLTGIDTTKSTGYAHDATLGLLKSSGSKSYVIETKTELTDIIPTRIVLTTEENTGTHQGVYFISRDNGGTWQTISPNTLFYFDDNVGIKDKKVRLRVELPASTQLLNYALTWV